MKCPKLIYQNNLFWQPFTIVDQLGVPIKITNGGLDVNIQDQFTEVIDLYLSKLVQVLTIEVNTNIDDTIVTVNSPSEPTDGNLICFKEDTAFYQAVILSHTPNGANWDVVLDTPLDYAFTTIGGCSERIFNMNVDGSTTNQIFTVSPANLTSGTSWDITRIIFTITDNSAMDDGKFGGLTALQKGVVLRVKNGITKNIFNVKTNGDFKLRNLDGNYTDATLGPSGNEGFSTRRTFNGQDKNGVTLRLNADTSDSVQLIIQDDLTGLVSFRAVAQGHIVE